MTETRIQTTAADLRHGDVVLTPEGSRWFAAFDLSVEVAPGFGPVLVRVWTAADDQDHGVPGLLTFDPAQPFTVARRNRGPVTTHTVLTLHDDGSVAVDRH